MAEKHASTHGLTQSHLVETKRSHHGEEPSSESQKLSQRSRIQRSRPRELLQHLLGLAKQKHGTRYGTIVAGKPSGAPAKILRNRLRKQIAQHVEIVPDKGFMRALASKVLAHSLIYKHTHNNNMDNKNNKNSHNEKQNGTIKHTIPQTKESTAGKSHTKEDTPKQPTSSGIQQKSKELNEKVSKSANRKAKEESPKRKRKPRLRYLTNLIYRLNRFYTNISSTNQNTSSRDGPRVLHIPFKRREANKLRKLFVSLIAKQSVLHVHNTSLIADMSKKKLLSFVHLLNQLDKSPHPELDNLTTSAQHGASVGNEPFDIEIDVHNTTRKVGINLLVFEIFFIIF